MAGLLAGRLPAARRRCEFVRLSAGGEWIRNFSSAPGRLRFRGFGRVGADRQSARRNHPSGRRPRQTDRAGGTRSRHSPAEMKAPTLLAVARHRRTESSNPFPSAESLRTIGSSAAAFSSVYGRGSSSSSSTWSGGFRSLESRATLPELPPNAAGDQRARLSPSNPIRMSSVGLRMCWTCAAKSRVCPTHCRADIPRQPTQTARRVDSGRLIDRLA